MSPVHNQNSSKMVQDLLELVSDSSNHLGFQERLDLIRGKIIDTFQISIQDSLSEVINSAANVSKSLDKTPPNIKLDGGEILVSKEIGRILSDCMGHIVRNAIDHGIETESARLAREESVGNIHIQFWQEHNALYFTAQDDGMGLDLDRIRRKLERAHAEVPEVPSQLAQMLFASGFSTKESVSVISGRGVGLDAVQTFVRSLGGDIKIELLTADMDHTPFRFSGFVPVAPEEDQELQSTKSSA